MLRDVWAGIQWAFGVGVETKQLTMGQMGLRALVIFIAGLIVVRLGDKRFLGKSTAFDTLLAVILGSVLGRAINGSAPFFPTVGTAFLLVGLHWVLAAIAFRSDHFGILVKGRSRTLVRDGEFQWGAMQKSHISRRDLAEAVRSNGKLSDVRRVQTAYDGPICQDTSLSSFRWIVPLSR